MSGRLIKVMNPGPFEHDVTTLKIEVFVKAKLMQPICGSFDVQCRHSIEIHC